MTTPSRAIPGLLLASLLFAFLAGGCGFQSPAPRGNAGTRPYTVHGKTYVPLKSAYGFDETGVASWYGPGFHGKRTASGEIFNQHALTAAHTVLPLGATVRVDNLENGKSVLVRINDRGPFASSRIIDLSYAAARHIGLLDKGTGRVRIRSVGSGPAAPPSPAPAPQNNAQPAHVGQFYIQTGAFGEKSAADRQAGQLRQAGQTARVVRKGVLWSVQTGPWRTRQDAQSSLDALKRRHPHAFIVDN